jgi:hypothetical protein
MTMAKAPVWSESELAIVKAHWPSVTAAHRVLCLIDPSRRSREAVRMQRNHETRRRQAVDAAADEIERLQDDVLFGALERASAEVNELRAALAAILAEPFGCVFCDSGKLRNPAKPHEAGCGFMLAERALPPNVSLERADAGTPVAVRSK